MIVFPLKKCSVFISLECIYILNRIRRDAFAYLVFLPSSVWPSCSKLTTSLVNLSLKFQKLISEIRQYVLSKKFEKHFDKKIPVYLVIMS